MLEELCGFDPRIVEVPHIPLAALDRLKRRIKIRGVKHVKVDNLTNR